MLLRYLTTIGLILLAAWCNGQSIKAPTITNTGGFFDTGTIKGGFSAGETAIGTQTVSGNTVLTGFHFILVAGNNACLLVTNILPDGGGSLREAIACASDGDTIHFDADLPGSFVYLDLPAIFCNKSLVLLADSATSLRNFNPSNTENLLHISKTLVFQGLSLDGTSETSMILKIDPGGGLVIGQGEVVRTDIRSD